MKQVSILDDVQAERNRQIAKGWTPEHDDEHGVDHLVHWARSYANRSGRGDLVKAAALLVAAVEVMDRKAPCPLLHAPNPSEGHGCDPEPQPGDGPDYHANHAAWTARNHRRDA